VKNKQRNSRGYLWNKAPEAAYARIENAVAQNSSTEGYDGIVFYDRATDAGDVIHPKQAFYI